MRFLRRVARLWMEHEELSKSGRTLLRAASPSHEQEPARVVQVSNQDISWHLLGEDEVSPTSRRSRPNKCQSFCEVDALFHIIT